MSHRLQPDQIARDLSEKLTGEARADRIARALYSTDASIYQIEPTCVALPATEEDVATVVNYAAEHGIAVTARGGGSGLAGEAIGEGIIVDMSRHMDRVVKVDAEANTVTVQAGVVLEQLNRQLAPLGKQIGPDPASGNRATIGGMIGNNSTGAHSIKYGYIGNHLREARVVGSSGEAATIGRDSAASSGGLAGTWAGAVDALLRPHQDAIEQARPKSARNGSGYNIFATLENGHVNLAELIAGAEGTLGVVTQATLALVDLPPYKALLQVNFDSLTNMARAVPLIMQLDPSACELMDGTLLGMARDAYPKYHDVLPGGVAASLLVELDDNNEGEVTKKLAQMRQHAEQMPSAAACVGVKEITDNDLKARVWAARKAAVPLLFRNKQATQPIPVVEDVAVPIERLADYIAGLDEITKRLDVPMAYYAHAGHGEMHPRPYLNLRDPEDVTKLRKLAEEVFEHCWTLGGTISGEHGEGLLRAAFIEKQYGAEVYGLFREVKKIFDPAGIMNPGKIINDDPDVMTKNLRFSYSQEAATGRRNLIWRDGELMTEAEQCNGNGLCRSHDPTLSMCPIFRATGDEDASPRGKGNVMRHWLYGLLDQNAIQDDDMKRVADLCVNCKMCAVQCPSLVNIPKLMLEARAQYVKQHGLDRTKYMLTRSELMSKMGCLFAPIANVFLGAGWFRRILEIVGGMDHRRPMPSFDWGSNLGKLRQRLKETGPVQKPVAKVAYFVDMYATYNDHELGRAVVDVLRHNNVEVIIPKQTGMAMPAISYGALDYARKAINYNLKHMAAAVRQGYQIIAGEPTAALCLKEEYLDIVDTPDAHLVAENTLELTEFLTTLKRSGQLQPFTTAVPMTLAYHMPCHYRYMEIDGGTSELLADVEGLNIETLPNSCCGIAGTFGFQKKNYDLSMKAGEPMLAPLRESQADFGLTECATCKMQMEQGAGKKVWHPAKLLAQAYGIDKRG